MPQMTIYLDGEKALLIREAARREDKSVSRWAAEQFDKALGASRWPEGYFGLFGSIDDESFESPDELPANRDTHRERL